MKLVPEKILLLMYSKWLLETLVLDSHWHEY